MTVKDFLNEMNRLAPFKSALEWDNVGLLVGRLDSSIEKVFVALDVSDSAIEKAVSNSCQLILTHHPMIFSPISSVSEYTPVGRNLLTMIENKINHIAMHTNFDIHIMGGIVAKKLGLTQWEVLDIIEEEPENRGIGIIFRLDKTMDLLSMAESIKKAFKLPYVTIYGNEKSNIDTVAIVPGSGKDEIEIAVSKGSEVLITGDIPYHHAMDSRALNLNIIDAGHYGLEYIFIEYMGEYIKNKFSGINVICEEIKFPGRVI